MRGGQNFVSGLQQGIHGTLDVLDRVDARRQRKADQGKHDLLFDQQQDDRLSQIERQKTLQGREDELYEEGQLDRQEARDDRQTAREHQAIMLPIEKQIREARLESSLNQNILTKANIRVARQKEKAIQGQRIITQAFAALDGGDYEAAGRHYKQLESVGYDVESMSDGGAQFADETMQKLLQGEVGFESQEVRELARRVLSPTIVQSGRDPARFSISGIVPTGRGTFMVSMFDQKTNKQVPATLGASDDPSDPPTELSMEDLMQATNGYIKMSEGAMVTKLNMAGAAFGVNQGKDGESALDRAEQMADIEHTKAQTRKLEEQAETEDAAVKAFVNSYEDYPGLKGVADILSQQPGFDPSQAAETIAGVREVMAQYESLPPMEAIKVYEKQQNLTRVIGQHTRELTAQHPDIEPSKLEKIVTDYQSGNIDEAAYERKLTLYENQSSRKKKREEEKQARKEALAERQSLTSRGSRIGPGPVTTNE